MEFCKTFMFLGIKRRVTSRGVNYIVDMYSPGGDHWDFWLRESDANRDMISRLLGAIPGKMMDCTIRVVRYDRSVNLRLIDAEDVA